MLSFNMLLRAADIAPEGVRLLRHQDSRLKSGWNTYRLWRHHPDQFRRYESLQAPNRLDGAAHIASFVVDPLCELIFVGLSRVISGRPTEPRDLEGYFARDDVTGPTTIYELECDARFSDLTGKLVIDWGPGARAWIQRADLQDKPIIELRRDVRDVEWPGYLGVRIDETEVTSLAPNWCEKLSATNGVYLLVCPQTGAQYVGAAFGEGGFLSRWSAYAQNGHGGNKLLIDRRQSTQAPLQISILEVFGSRMTEEDAFRAETRWKMALGSRAHGLNAN